RIDRADVLGLGVAVELLIGARVAGDLVDDYPVVLLAAEHVGRAVAVLVQAVRPAGEVKLDGAGCDLGGRAGCARVARVRRDHAVVLIGDVAAGVGRILQGHVRVRFRDAGRRRAVGEALRPGLVVRALAQLVAVLGEAQVGRREAVVGDGAARHAGDRAVPPVAAVLEGAGPRACSRDGGWRPA